MKKITISAFAVAIVASAFLITSCKKGEMGPEGAAGMNGTDGVVATSTDGFIKGSVSGTRQDGTAFNETFEFNNYWGTPSGILDSNSTTNYDFNISRGTSITENNRASININTSSKTASSGNITLNDFMFTKSLGTNKKFEFTCNSNPTTAITGLSYNTSSGLFTGSYSFTVNGFQNSTGNTATISGSFQATMTQMYYLIKQTEITSATK